MKYKWLDKLAVGQNLTISNPKQKTDLSLNHLFSKQLSISLTKKLIISSHKNSTQN
jgi:hypothetical protein